MIAQADTELYPFTNRNLITDPEFYFYSRFGGRPFMEAYRAVRSRHRARFLEQLCERCRLDASGEPSAAITAAMLRSDLMADDVRAILAAAPLAPRPDEKERRALPDPGVLPEVDTSTWLRILVDTLLVDRNVVEPGIARWLDEFLKRFEVTKRLYASYSGAFRRIGDAQAPASSYPCLSLALLAGYRRTGRLKWLNGLLKVNDVVCSLPPAHFDVGDLLYAIAAIDGEGQAVARLAAEGGVAR